MVKVYFSDAQLRAVNTLVSDGIWRINTFMYVLLTYKDEKSNEGIELERPQHLTAIFLMLKCR